jgi:glycosyltransferase involved in cell wall biosynthesis
MAIDDLTSVSSEPPGIGYFRRWLRSKQADIYHQHHWNRRCGLEHLRVAQALGLATVITIHDPVPICHRHTLMLYGEQACDGKIDTARCSRCCGVPLALPGWAVGSLSHLPGKVVNRIELPPGVKIWTNQEHPNYRGIKAIAASFLRSLVVPTYIAQHQHDLWQMCEAADRIIAVCQWLYDALLINGVPQEKLVLSRCGVAETVFPVHSKSRSASVPLKLVFLGRWDPNKGIHILVEAIQSLPENIPVELTIYAVEQVKAYRRQILNQIADDPRFRVESPLSRADIPTVLPHFDLLVAPSQWLEAGPLVVLEAHALGVPVLGSNLGGIAELVQHGSNGWLVESQNIAEWRTAIATFAQNRALLDKLREGIQSVRTIYQQAEDLARIYHRLLSRKNSDVVELRK